MSIIKRGEIRIGKAQTEGRAPSHDGEYLAVYYSGDGGYIIEGNGGVVCTHHSINDVLSGASDDAFYTGIRSWQAAAEAIVDTDSGEDWDRERMGSDSREVAAEFGWLNFFEKNLTNPLTRHTAGDILGMAGRNHPAQTERKETMSIKRGQKQTMKNWTEDRIYDLVHDENSNLTATGYERSFAQRVALGENPHEVIRDLYPGAPFCSHNVRVGFNRMRTVANLIHPL